MMSRFLQRRFSLMLALRYLNPLRTYFSVITLICLVGVSLGVMVLVVVLSVMGGLQREIKGRFLAYAPHVTVSYCQAPGQLSVMSQWREVVDSVKGVKGVQSAYPMIEDYVMVDASGAQKPSSFRAVDTENPEQMKELSAMIAEGSFDMSMGEEAVISTGMAQSMGIHVGDTLRVYAKRNFEDVLKAYKRSEQSLKKQEGKTLDIMEKLWNGVSVSRGLEWVGADKVAGVKNVLNGWLERDDLRASEAALADELYLLVDEPENAGEKGLLGYPAGSGKRYRELIERIRRLDTDKEDLEAFKQIKEIVLPRDLTVLGIYQSSRHVASPEIFVPLNIGQELLGFEDAAQGVAVRARDPYLLEPVEKAVAEALPALAEGEGLWVVRNWTDNPALSTFVKLMQQERVMISFVLFFITLVAAFCIMAVMFAMSIQRKKEIAVMRALGATPLQVVLVFLWQGLMIGFVGSLSGVGLGLLVLRYRAAIREFLMTLNFDPFPVGFHGVQIPAFVNVNELVMISVTSFVLVVIASIIPALVTSRQDPAKSLRSL